MRLCASPVADSPESGEPGVGNRIARWLQFLDQLRFALAGMGGQFEAESRGRVVPDRFVGRVFPVPVAQQAFAHLAFADEKHFAFLVTETIDAWGVRSFEFNPRLAPGVVVAFDSRHDKRFHPNQSLWNCRDTKRLCASPVPFIDAPAPFKCG